MAVAEAIGLDQLEGIGLRKAMEFLVKDYAISKNPDQEEDIRSKFLGACINEYIIGFRCASSAPPQGN